MKTRLNLFLNAIVVLGAWCSLSYALADEKMQLTDEQRRSVRENSAHCKLVGSAAAEVSEYRERGMTLEDAKRAVGKRFASLELERGALFAFTYRDLKGFALFDFVDHYCYMVLSHNGKLSDFATLMLQSRFQLTRECSKAGHVEQQAFFACWNARTAAATKGATQTLR
jgi:hypothetical protein